MASPIHAPEAAETVANDVLAIAGELPRKVTFKTVHFSFLSVNSMRIPIQRITLTHIEFPHAL